MFFDSGAGRFLLPCPSIPFSFFHGQSSVAVSTQYCAFIYFHLDLGYRVSSGCHNADCLFLSRIVMELKNNGVSLAASFTRVSGKVVPNIFSCHFTGCLFSFLDVFQMPLFGIPFIPFLGEIFPTIAAGFLPDPKSFPSPGKSFIIFIFFTVVAFFHPHLQTVFQQNDFKA